MAFIFVCPRGIIEKPFNRSLHFPLCLVFAGSCQRIEPPGKFGRANRKVFRQIVQSLPRR